MPYLLFLKKRRGHSLFGCVGLGDIRRLGGLAIVREEDGKDAEALKGVLAGSPVEDAAGLTEAREFRGRAPGAPVRAAAVVASRSRVHEEGVEDGDDGHGGVEGIEGAPQKVRGRSVARPRRDSLPLGVDVRKDEGRDARRQEDLVLDLGRLRAEETRGPRITRFEAVVVYD